MAPYIILAIFIGNAFRITARMTINRASDRSSSTTVFANSDL